MYDPSSADHTFSIALLYWLFDLAVVGSRIRRLETGGGGSRCGLPGSFMFLEDAVHVVAGREPVVRVEIVANECGAVTTPYRRRFWTDARIRL